MNFKATHLIFLGAFIVFLGLAYAVVFGDAGLWMRGDLTEREITLKESIEELRRENKVLHRKYHALNRIETESPANVSGAGGIILKFDGKGSQASGRPGASSGITIHEARGLYAVGALFLILLGVYLAGSSFILS